MADDTRMAFPGTFELVEEQLPDFAKSFAQQLEYPVIVFLCGELGAGKTSFARCLLTHLGATGPVKSPTYTLVESYSLDVGAAAHFDLYRLENSDELEFLGARELIAESALTLIEWPERAAGGLPAAHWRIQFEHLDDARRVVVTRP